MRLVLTETMTRSLKSGFPVRIIVMYGTTFPVDSAYHHCDVLIPEIQRNFRISGVSDTVIAGEVTDVGRAVWPLSESSMYGEQLL